MVELPKWFGAQDLARFAEGVSGPPRAENTEFLKTRTLVFSLGEVL